MEEKRDILNFIKVKQGTTPDANYFDNLAKDIIENETPIIKLPFYKKTLFWSLSAAASIAIIMLLTPPTTPKSTLVAELSSEEITQYVEENIDDFDTDMIEEFVILETTNEPASESISIEEQIDELTEEEILEYFESEYVLDEFDENDLYI